MLPTDQAMAPLHLTEDRFLRSYNWALVAADPAAVRVNASVLPLREQVPDHGGCRGMRAR
jgi:hypothetical protein